MNRNLFSWMMVMVTALALLLTVSLAVAQEATPETTPAPETAAAAPAAESAAPAAAPASSGMITGLRHLHSAVRWLVVLLAVAALVKIGLVYFQGGAYDKLAQRLMIGFSGALTLQWLIGIVFFITYAGVVGFGVGHIWLHLIVMTVAMSLSHMSPRWKKADDRTRARASLMLIVAALVLVVIGVALLPQGWRMFPPSG